MKTKTILLTLTLAALTAPAAQAQNLDITISGDIRLGRRPPPPPPPVVVIVEDTGSWGPSPWERGRWYQRRQGYYYYPGGDVYYRPADQVWFYQERGQWRSGRNLPDWVRIDFHHNIVLTMATNRPYAFHQQVVTRYPSNYFGTRVRLRDDDRQNRGNSDHGRDHRGNDRGRGQDDRKKSNDRGKGR
jgi:hypothetical protein